MAQTISVRLTDDARSFLHTLDKEVRIKFGVSIRRTQDGQTGDWFKKLTGTDLYEFRVDAPNHTYRLFAFWDKRNKADTLIVCTHGLDKKTQKTPAADLKKAERIRAQYFEDGS
jgi:phage-related protein